MADLEGEALQAGAGAGDRGEQCGVAVAGNDLRRHVLALQAEAVEGRRLDARVAIGIGADGAGELAHADALEGGGQPVALAPQLGHPAQQLEPEGGRLGVHAVGAADRRGVPELLGPGQRRRSRSAIAARISSPASRI